MNSSKFSKFIVFFLLSFSVFAQNTMLVLDTGENPTRNQMLAQKAKARGQKIIFYPGPGKEMKSADLRVYLSTAKFDTLVLAGHSGTGDFSGSKGDIKKEDLLYGITHNPYAKKNCHELLTLGCNTANKTKTWYYKAMFDDLKILHGYSGSAPLSYKKDAVNYVNDFFNNADKIKNASTEDELLKIMKGMSSSDVVNSGIYVNCPAGEYYYSHEEENKEPGKLEKYELKAGCDEKQKIFVNDFQAELNEYMTGNKPIDEDTDKGFLRDAYTFINRNEQCLQGGELGFSVQKALMLLFNKNYMANFTTYYKPLFEKALAEIELTEKPGALKTKLENGLNERIKLKQECVSHPKECIEKKEKALAELQPFETEYQDILKKGTLSEAEYTKLKSLESKHFLYDQISYTDIASVTEQVEYLKDEKAHLNQMLPDIQKTLKEASSYYQKFINEPAKITRKDLLRFSDLDLWGLGGVLKYQNHASNAVNSAFNLEDDAPFSWHEAPRKRIEDPESYLSIGQMMKDETLSPELLQMSKLSAN